MRGQSLGEGDIAGKLAELEIEADHAAAYVTLWQKGPLSASDLAGELGIPRTRAYRILDALTQRQWAAVTLSRPQRFQATDPDQALSFVIEEARRRLDRAQRVKEEVVPVLHEKAGDEGGRWARERFRLIEGAPRVRGVLRRLTSKAEQTLCLANLGLQDAHTVVSPFDEVSRVLAARPVGVGARALVPAKAGGVEADVEDDVELRRHATARPIRFAIVDEREVLVVVAEEGASQGREGREVVLWTDSRTLVAIHATLFEELWRSAAPR